MRGWIQTAIVPAAIDRRALLLGALVSILLTPGANAADIELAFASPDEGKQVLTSRDDFLRRLSPFDRQSRVQSDKEVSESQYLEYVSKQLRPWTDAQRQQVQQAFALVKPAIDHIAPELKGDVQVVQTSGQEESGAAYTRGLAIVLPTGRLSDNRGDLARLLAHEMFHVVSRQHPELRDQLYRTIGFKRTNEIQLPESMQPRRITNPDAPVIQHVIELRDAEGQPMQVAPVLFASGPYEPEKNRRMFAYLSFQLMQVAKDASDQYQPVVNGEEVAFHNPNHPDFGRQIGRNTGYIIHPEEILADNFADIVTGRTDAPDPQIPAQMLKVFQKYSGAAR